MFIELAAEIPSVHNTYRNKFVQINVYDAGIEEFKKCGIDVLAFLKSLGFPNCLIMEVPLLTNAGIETNGRRQNHDIPESNQGIIPESYQGTNIEPVAVPLTATVAEAEAEPQEVQVLRDIKEEVIEPTMKIEQGYCDVNYGCDLFNADISVVQPVGGNLSIDLDSTCNRLDERLFKSRDEIVSPGIQSFSGIPAPCRTSTRIDEGDVSESSVLVSGPLNVVEILPKSSTSNEIGTEDFVLNAQAGRQLNNGDADTSNSEICCQNTGSGSHCTVTEASPSEECRRDLNLDVIETNETEKAPLEHSLNLSSDTVLLGEVQDGLENIAGARQLELDMGEGLQSGMANKTRVGIGMTSKCAENSNNVGIHDDENFVEARSGYAFTEGDCFFSPDVSSFNIDGLCELAALKGDRLNQDELNSFTNLLNDTLGVGCIADSNNKMEAAECEARHVQISSENVNAVTVVDNISTEVPKCSYSYPNPILPADASINNIIYNEVKQEQHQDENEYLNASTALNCSFVSKAGDLRKEPSFTIATPAGVNKSEDSFVPDDCVSDDCEDFDDAPEYQTDEDLTLNDWAGPSAPKRKKRNRKAVYKCLYPNCKTEFRQRKFVHQKMIAHVQSHSPAPLFSCMVTGCDVKLKTNQAIAHHYTNEHPGVTFPGVAAIKRKITKTVPPDIEATLWKQCFPESDCMDYKTWRRKDGKVKKR